MSVERNDQTSLYETQLENPEVEELLEAREEAKAQASAVAKRARNADAAARAALEQLDLGNGAPVRIGRFVVGRRRVAARSVAFETEPRDQLVIKTIE